MAGKAGASGAAADGAAPTDSGSDGGCGCRVVGEESPAGAYLGLGVLALFVARRRRRHER